ncbi:MAG: protoheme IX farnesyltransferase [Bacteroides sp.]|nr:protoheme IX farnesyltransferase [Bacteroides sp.]
MSSPLSASYFRALLKLGKFTIALPVALTGFLGYFLHTPLLDRNALLVISGVFLLSMGSGAINQIQERDIDARMDRTRSRPIPAGIIRLNHAIIFSLIFSIAGLVILALTGELLAAGIGLFTLFWYNGVYTPLKRVTAFAVFPGALIGALPPLIGWAAAGGSPLDLEIVLVAFLLFVGQMPHYWLLLLKIGSQFRDAGMPVITNLLAPRQIRNLSFIWIAATAVIVLMLPVTPIMGNRLISVLLIFLTIAFMIRMFRLSYRGDLMKHWKKAFITVNLFYLVIILALIANKIVETNFY